MPDEAKKGERIAKVMARAGVCSRRDAEKLIAKGVVAVNGVTVGTPAFFVKPDDSIVADGKPVPVKEPTRVWRYHKPAGLIVSHNDEKNRKTVFETLPAGMPRVISVGRLDFNSEGLLLLTNDGAFSRYAEMPSTGWVRRYRVRIHGKMTEEAKNALEQGVTVDGIAYKGVKVVIDKEQNANQWLTVSLTEGKNREIRKLMAHFGYDVTRLIRVAYGPFQLGMLPRGAVEEVSAKVLREQIGAKAGILLPEKRGNRSKKGA